MLAFLINNTPLALSTETSVRIIWINPACFFDSIPGDVAMGIDIPVNEVNRMLMGNPERFEKRSSSTSREIPGFEIRYSGYLLLAGTLIIQNASGTAYSGWARSSVGNLGKEHREKFIYDIPAFDANISFTNKANYDPDTDHYGCPTYYNPEFFKDKGRKIKVDTQVPNPDYVEGNGEPAFITDQIETEALTEAFRRSSLYFVNPTYIDHVIKTEVSTSPIATLEDNLNVYVVSPMLFLSYVIKTLLADAKFYVVNDAISANDDLKKLVIWNNFDITNMDFKTKELITTIITQDWSNSSIYISGGTVQTMSEIIGDVVRHYNGTFKYRDLLPKVRLKDFILGIQNLLNVCFHFLPGGKVNIIDREAIVTSTPIDINSYMVAEWEIGEKKDITLKFMFTHDDEDTYFSERWEDVDDRRPDEKEPVETWNDLIAITNPEIGEMRYIKSENIYAQYNWLQQKEQDVTSGNEIMTDAIGWEHIAAGFQNGFFNSKKEEEEQIETVFSTIPGDQTVMSYHPGNIQSMKLAYQNFTPRLFFYTGNNTAKHETTTLSLDWEKENTGLIAKRWPKWARFWCQRLPVTGEAALPLNMLDYITRNITNKFRVRGGEFIIETMETEFSLNRIGTTKITGYKSDYVPAVHGLTQHWAPGNLVLMDELIDFTGFDNLNFNI
jgi:hypothetical protein